MIANIEAEQSLIGSILLGGSEILSVVQQIIGPDDFQSPEMQTIYNACTKLFMQNKPIDAISVLAVTGEEYKPVIVSAAQIVPSTSHAAEYASIVREAAQKARAYNLTSELLVSLEGSTDGTECQHQAEEILKCFDQPKQDDTVSAEEMYLRFFDRQNHPKQYIKTGFSKLDKYTYIERGDYIIIGARPSAGKTAFTLQMMKNIAKTYTTVYFSLETNNDKLGDRTIGEYNAVPMSEIKTNKISDEEWERITNGYDTFRKLKLHTVRASGYSVEQIQAKSLQLHADVIFVDYVTLVNQKGDGLVEQATKISKGLHTLAQKNGITVVALSQLNREGKKEPDMTSLRDSGQFEQDADCIMLIEYDEDMPDERDIKIVKNKEGRCGKIKFDFQPDIQRFSEVETRCDET
jgi:replicative DNA helicase